MTLDHMPAFLILQVKVITFMLAQAHQNTDGTNESDVLESRIAKAWVLVSELG